MPKTKIYFGYWQCFAFNGWGFVTITEAPYSLREMEYCKRWVKRYRKYVQDNSYDVLAGDDKGAFNGSEAI